MEKIFATTEDDKGNLIITKFIGFDNQRELVIPAVIDGRKVVGIGKNAFRSCRLLNKVNIEDGIRYIESGAFAGCTSLNEIRLPKTVRRFGAPEDWCDEAGVFQGCVKLKLIAIPEGISKIPERMFYSSGITTIQLPNSLSTINQYAFGYCKYLRNINFPASLRDINSRAFYECTSFLTLELNEGLEEIGFEAFKGLRASVRVVVPSTVRYLGKDALGSIYTNPHSVKHIRSIFCYPNSEAVVQARDIGYGVDCCHA